MTSSNEWIELFEAEALCKASSTCTRLEVREYFFEPNPGTMPIWNDAGLYERGIDRRVMFVCESPSDIMKPLPPDFVVRGVNGYRCWAGYNWRTAPFFDMRKAYGLENCMITNTVKCGCPKSVKAKPDDGEIRNCAPFLRREIELVQPAVVACVGRWAESYAAAAVAAAAVTPKPAFVYLTHYSAHMPRPILEVEWREQFQQIRNEIRRRSLPTNCPVWLEFEGRPLQSP